MARALQSVLLLLAACATPAAKPTTAVAPNRAVIVVQPHDLIHARANLEMAEDADEKVERWPRIVLDSLAEALAALREVDSLTRSQLGPDSFWTSRWSTITGMILQRGSKAAACIEAIRPEQIPASRIPCWPSLDSLLLAVEGARIVEASYDPTPQFAFRVEVPIPYSRLRIIQRIEAAGLSAGIAARDFWVLPEPFFNLHEYERVDRSVMPWRYVITRGYGDCPSGCIHHRYYVYRFDPQTRRAWKETEYGDPYPEPAKQPFRVPPDAGVQS